MLIKISRGKELYKVMIGYVNWEIDIHFNLDNHNVLLETNYDLWVLNYFRLIANIEWTYRIAHNKGLGWD